jgi:tetratricopeptide (TPR) repeat protein
MRKISYLFLLISALLIASAVFSYAASTGKDTASSNLSRLKKELAKAETAVDYLEAETSALLEDEDQAKKSYRKIAAYNTQILNDPGSTYIQRLEATRQVARLNLRCGEYKEAINILKAFLAEYPDNQPVSNDLAEALYFQAMDYAREEDGFQKAVNNINEILKMPCIDLNWQPHMKYYMASLYQGRARYKEALQWYDRIIRDHPEHKNWPALAHLSMAEYYLAAGDIFRSRKHLESIITGYPESVWVKQANDMLKEISSK